MCGTLSAGPRASVKFTTELCCCHLRRGLCGDDGVLWPEQKNGLLHHPDLHPLHPHCGPLLGLLLDQERRHTGPNGSRYCGPPAAQRGFVSETLPSSTLDMLFLWICLFFCFFHVPSSIQSGYLFATLTRITPSASSSVLLCPFPPLYTLSFCCWCSPVEHSGEGNWFQSFSFSFFRFLLKCYPHFKWGVCPALQLRNGENATLSTAISNVKANKKWWHYVLHMNGFGIIWMSNFSVVSQRHENISHSSTVKHCHAVVSSARSHSVWYHTFTTDERDEGRKWRRSTN